MQSYAVSGRNYTFTLNANETIAPSTLSYNGSPNIGLTLVGAGAERTISLSANGSTFTVGRGVMLTLGNNVTLQGRSSNTRPLVVVDPGGGLVMNVGSKIKGNKTLFTTLAYGGGVFVDEGGAFTMNGGEISGNTASGFAGGVCAGGTFTMNGGTISGNESTNNNGGGVSVLAGAFTMNGGTISGNEADDYGGGVCVYKNATFTMAGGEISGNKATGGGGGVDAAGTFTMTGGTISGNLGLNGGGVLVSVTFRIVNGTIYGSNEATASLRNLCFQSGAALNNRGTAQRGTFSGSTWNSLGSLSTTNNTIRVVNGVLQ
jgi:hypothetical protein